LKKRISLYIEKHANKRKQSFFKPILKFLESKIKKLTKLKNNPKKILNICFGATQWNLLKLSKNIRALAEPNSNEP
jgi:hypothetical protein